MPCHASRHTPAVKPAHFVSNRSDLVCTRSVGREGLIRNDSGDRSPQRYKGPLTSCATWEKAPAHAICNAVQLSQSIRSRSPPVAIYFWTLSKSPLWFMFMTKWGEEGWEGRQDSARANTAYCTDCHSTRRLHAYANTSMPEDQNEHFCGNNREAVNRTDAAREGEERERERPRQKRQKERGY